MLFLYNLGIKVYYLLVWLAAMKNRKAKQFIDGRKKLLSLIAASIPEGTESAWFHFASLGEFEQGSPVLEEFKRHSDLKIVITFFSPSGFEARKKYIQADYVFYLPLDTKSNAKHFIEIVNPKLAVFTKYEYWYHYYHTLKKNDVPIYVISAIFRPEQVFFKWYGDFQRSILRQVKTFFVQNKESVELLKSIGIGNVHLSGDTRFDRVASLPDKAKQIEKVENFINSRNVIVAGSTWPEDELLLTTLSQTLPEWKFIIAPHEVHSERINKIQDNFPRSVRFTEYNGNSADEYLFLIIDNIGMLSSLYRYATISYIGGGFGKGIHNTLEAATYGVPVIFGPNYLNFKEAKDLISVGAARSINNSIELSTAVTDLTDDTAAGTKAKDYVLSNTGATQLIISRILPSLPNSQSI